MNGVALTALLAITKDSFSSTPPDCVALGAYGYTSARARHPLNGTDEWWRKMRTFPSSHRW